MYVLRSDNRESINCSAHTRARERAREGERARVSEVAIGT